MARRERKKPTPPDAARKLRAGFATSLPADKTAPVREYLTAWHFARLVMEQAGCGFAAAADATAEVVPELMA